MEWIKLSGSVEVPQQIWTRETTPITYLQWTDKAMLGCNIDVAFGLESKCVMDDSFAYLLLFAPSLVVTKKRFFFSL